MQWMQEVIKTYGTCRLARKLTISCFQIPYVDFVSLFGVSYVGLPLLWSEKMLIPFPVLKLHGYYFWSYVGLPLFTMAKSDQSVVLYEIVCS